MCVSNELKTPIELVEIGVGFDKLNQRPIQMKHTQRINYYTVFSTFQKVCAKMNRGQLQ